MAQLLKITNGGNDRSHKLYDMYATSIDRLINILNELREKCPWDKKQTLQSLRPQTTEELYELTDSISRVDWAGIREELGDLLLHILFYSKIAAEQEQFNFSDVVRQISDKLIRRHPHIYDHVQAEDEEAVKRNWEQIKLKEGKKSVLSGVPESMPAMIKALRLQEKTRQVGFEWEHIDQVKDKVNEEITELYEAAASGDQDKTEEELGDVFFALINYARFSSIDPEQALERTNRKFIRRFTYIEEQAALAGKDPASMSLEEMDALWNRAKEQE